jgi:hypothetical protein
MSSEIRALKEFKWEVKNARRLVRAAAGWTSKEATDFDEEDF